VTQPSTEELDRAIGDALRSARLSRTYTQAEMARVLAVTRSAVAHYEAGKRSLSASQLIRAALALECPVHHLLPPISSLAPLPVNERTLSGPVAQIVQLLEQRPDLIPNVLDLLETMLELSETSLDDSGDQDSASASHTDTSVPS
jgi:transcriptional regulator with XRE-family HTH domain